MTKPAAFHWALVVALAHMLSGLLSASPQTVPAAPQKLGQLEIIVSKVERFSMIADTFDGRTTSSSRVGRIYLRIKNVGDFPVCTSLVPSVEEFKGTEWQYTQPIKTGFAYNPKIEKLRPAAETTGYYDFRPSPQNRAYVLVLRQGVQTQKCSKTSERKNTTMSDGPTVQFSLSESSK
jgi:hypothetical protein